jgi:hypothetical protein
MPYYIDGPSLATATAVYTNAALSICAADGVYSDGTITRIQTSCVLGSAKFCPSCGSDCSSDFNGYEVGDGVFNIEVDLGNSIGDTGAIAISFNSLSIPKGFIASYDGINYNTFSSQIYGLLTAPTGLPVYVGDQDNDCGIVSSGPHTLNNYDWDSTTSAYVYNGTTSSVSALPTQIQTTVNAPGNCVMIIPKPLINPSTLHITVFSPCAPSGIDLNVSCPIPLFPTYTSQVRPTADSVCQYPDDLIYYNYPVNGNGVTLGLFDWVFNDANGETIAADGYYHAPTMLPGSYNWFLVQSGIIIQMGECQYDAYIIQRCGDGLTLVANSSVPGIVIGNFVTVSFPSYEGCTFEVISETFTMPTVTIDAISPYESCADVCLTYSIDNMTASTQTVSYSDCDGLSQTVSVPAYTIDYVCARVGSVSVPGSPAGVIVSIDSCNC